MIGTYPWWSSVGVNSSKKQPRHGASTMDLVTTIFGVPTPTPPFLGLVAGAFTDVRHTFLASNNRVI